MTAEFRSTAPKCEVKSSPIHGDGLFAASAIKDGEILLFITGRMVTTDSLSDAVIAEGHWQGVAPGRCLVSDEATSFHFINHSQAPNSAVDLARMAVIASREIAAGEEITLDYRVEPMDDRCRRLLGKLTG